MIELRDVTKVFNAGSRTSSPRARRQSDAQRPRDGRDHRPSGSGKTTLLSLIACMAGRPRPHSGGRRDDFQPAGTLSHGDPRRTFGFIFQQFNLIRGLSAREN